MHKSNNPEDAMTMLLETLELMQQHAALLNNRVAHLENKIEALEDNDREILFVLQTVVDEQPHTFH